MTISVKTRKLLWGNAANKCSFPECKKKLVMDETETDDVAIIGEECHIIAREGGGPRGNSKLSKDKRDLYNNLVLMCRNHHKVIDDQEHTYTVEKLNDIKRSHEKWVDAALNMDDSLLKDELSYAFIVDTWIKKTDLNNWDSWASLLLLADQPRMYIERLQELKDFKYWLFKMIMPQRFVNLEGAFENFRLILQDFILTFESHVYEREGIIYTKKFYSELDEWNPEKYTMLLKEYHFHVDLVEDLALELTRAANLICDQVRKYILPDFHMREGLIVITSGPHHDLSNHTHRPRYSLSERENTLYTNLHQFKLDRQNRDYYFGRGRNVKESETLGVDNRDRF